MRDERKLRMNMSENVLGKIMSRTGFWKAQEKKERRRSKRYRVDLPVRFRMFPPSRPDQATPALRAQLYDISEHGLGLLTDAIEWEGIHMIDPNMQTSEMSVLEIEIPYDKEPLRVRGRAVWYIRHPEGIPFVFRVGVEFVDLMPEVRRGIETLISVYASAAEVGG